MNLEVISKQAINLIKAVGFFIHTESKKISAKDIEEKGFNDFVTYVDKEAEQRLINELRKIIPQAGFIVEEDRLNKNSCIVINKDGKLYKFFKHGNWCLGQSIIHKDLCFIQQVDGGDEWLTIKNFDDEAVAFESISFDMIHYKEFADVIINLLHATKEQCINLEWNTRQKKEVR